LVLKVQTYIQSGNVFVTTEEENAAKVGFIIKQDYLSFGGDVLVIILSAADLETCFTSNPFFERERSRHEEVICCFCF
jgi:uncharacterized protein (DUF1697 family)